MNDSGKRIEIVFVDGFKFGNVAGTAWFQSIKSAESCVSQNSLSSVSFENGGIGLSFLVLFVINEVVSIRAAIVRLRRFGRRPTQSYDCGSVHLHRILICTSRSCNSVTLPGAPSRISWALLFMGKATTSRMLSCSVRSMTIRSNPGAIPACGGAP